MSIKLKDKNSNEQLFQEALKDLDSYDFNKYISSVSKLADKKNGPRINYLLGHSYYDLYEVEKEKRYLDIALEYLLLAVKKNYPFAYLPLINYYRINGKNKELFKLINDGAKLNEVHSLLMLGEYHYQLYSSKSNSKELVKTRMFYEQTLSSLYDILNSYDKDVRYKEFVRLSFASGIDEIKQLIGYTAGKLMRAYGYIDNYNDFDRFKQLYDQVLRFGSSVDVFNASKFYFACIVDDTFGLKDLINLNQGIERVENSYRNLPEDEITEDIKEWYNQSWKYYNDLYEGELERYQAKLNISYTSFNNIADDDYSGVDLIKKWADSTQDKHRVHVETTIEMDNINYNVNDNGEILNEYGGSTGLRLDKDSKKVYDSKMNVIGWFDSTGIFHKY